jgi:hypothetical protein
MKLTQEQIDTIRDLHARGHAVNAIAESFSLSRRFVRELCTDVPSAEAVEAVRQERQRLEEEAEVASDATSFAGFAGEQAEWVCSLFMSTGFDVQLDGGDATRDGNGRPRKFTP